MSLRPTVPLSREPDTPQEGGRSHTFPQASQRHGRALGGHAWARCGQPLPRGPAVAGTACSAREQVPPATGPGPCSPRRGHSWAPLGVCSRGCEYML